MIILGCNRKRFEHRVHVKGMQCINCNNPTVFTVLVNTLCKGRVCGHGCGDTKLQCGACLYSWTLNQWRRQ